MQVVILRKDPTVAKVNEIHPMQQLARRQELDQLAAFASTNREELHKASFISKVLCHGSTQP